MVYIVYELVCRELSLPCFQSRVREEAEAFLAECLIDSSAGRYELREESEEVDLASA